MDGIDPDSVRHTIVDGIEVTWYVLDHAARVESIREVDGRVLMSYRGPGYPDVAQAEELWPRFSGVWAAVRDEQQQVIAESRDRSRADRSI
ncbi:hypothetical protein C5E45_16475 [Nocardia nova]|uniref:Uncharacterized protein n=1 Tax=Nocardia nova TaxID=37330 RepID=A0A2S6APV3_9NOCA|nr:hypothetical protein [Nocardia nova]PPJ27806.1 hypothetical protein C5E41_14365 [Nocardia nova]PPJ37242.1 hypothetical protein C5E45_16475 [Nocardia nova]